MDDTQKSLEPEKRKNTLKGQRRKINTPNLLIKKRSKETPRSGRWWCMP